MSDDNETESADAAEQPKPDEGRTTCTPCRGTGQVISNLGGEPKQVACPWCDGTGQFIPGHDAQGQPSEEDPAPAP